MIKLSKENKAILNMLNVIAPENAKVIRCNLNYAKRLHKGIVKHVELSGGSEYMLNTASGMIEELKHVNRKVVELMDMAREDIVQHLIGSVCGNNDDLEEDWFGSDDDDDSTPFDIDNRRKEYTMPNGLTLEQYNDPAFWDDGIKF